MTCVNPTHSLPRASTLAAAPVGLASPPSGRSSRRKGSGITARALPDLAAPGSPSPGSLHWKSSPDPGGATRAAGTTAAAVVLALAALGSVACGGESASTTAAAGPDAVYEVRGEIARLPEPGSTDVWIRHEAIPDFRNASGETVGMDSMTMPFGVDPQTPFDELAVGDRIAFRLELDWDAPSSPSRVVDVRKLEPGTRLGFDPPAEEPPAAEDQGSGAEPAAEGATPR